MTTYERQNAIQAIRNYFGEISLVDRDFAVGRRGRGSTEVGAEIMTWPAVTLNRHRWDF